MRDLIASFTRFKGYFKDYKMAFFWAILGMILASVGTAASAYLVKPVLDKIFIEKNETLLYLLPYAIIAVYAAKSLGVFLQSYFTAYIGQDIVRRFRNLLLEHLLSLDLAFFHVKRSGELISRNISDIERIRSIVSNIIPEFAREAITIVALLAVVIYQSPLLALFALIIFPAAIYPLSRLAKRMKKISTASQEKNSDISAALSEIFANIEAIKAANAENMELNRFKSHNQKFFELNIKAVKTNQLVSPIMETLGSIGIAVVIIIGGSQVISGAISVGSFFSFLTALFMLYTPLKRASNLYNSSQDAVAAANRTFALLDLRPSIIPGKLTKSRIDEIRLNEISFCYGDKTALNKINLNAKRGEILALVGGSGGGKSTIINLILRFFDPKSGNIILSGDGDDHNLKDLDLAFWRQNIGLVSQRVYIFNDTIAANVAYGAENIDENRVINALKMANAYEFVEAMEGGINARLDEFGVNLSGGQRQRIAIARALYKDPQILIFDEATSALDNKSERYISEAISNIVKDRIAIIIAHRLSTIQNADKIAVIDAGEVVATGTDSELSATCQIYQKLKNSAKG